MKKFAVVLGLASFSLWAANVTWQPTTDAKWSEAANWSNNSLPGAADTAIFDKALAADAVVDMDSETPVAKLSVRNSNAATKYIFNGAQEADTLELTRGDTELRGTWHSGKANNTIVGNTANVSARLELSGSAQLCATNGGGLYVGNVTNSIGQLFVRDDAQLRLSTSDTENGLNIGRNAGSIGTVLLESGVIEAAGRFYPGYNGYGAFEMFGGSFTAINDGKDARFRLTVNPNSTGFFYQRGGTVRYVAGKNAGSWGADIGCAKANTTAIWYMDGGTFNSDFKISLGSGATQEPTATGVYNEYTIAGTAQVNNYPNRLFVTAETYENNAFNVFNLNRGGTLRTANISYGKKSDGVAMVNFDGGFLEMHNASEISKFLEEVAAVTIYEGGFNVALKGEAGVTLLNLLRNPSGWGADDIDLTDGGSGYLAPPVVKISGGSGSNATAVAFVDYTTGSITGLVLTCRGSGYAEADNLDVSFNGGGGSGGSAIVTLKKNKTGALVKGGPQRLMMSTPQSEFAGAYVVTAGRFYHTSVNSSGSPNVEAVCVTGATAEFLNGHNTSANNTPERCNLVNPEATLYFGGFNGGGTFLQPCGSDDTIFSQHFDQVVVEGPGGSTVITSARQGDNGALLEAGTLTRMPGAMLQISSVSNLVFSIEEGAAEHLFGNEDAVFAGVTFDNSGGLATYEDGKVVPLVDWQTEIAPDNNLYVEGELVAGLEDLIVNSITITNESTLTLAPPADVTVVQSGMIVAPYGSSNGGALITGGRLTSGNGQDLILYDRHRIGERRNLETHKVGLTVDAQIVDNGGTPITLLATGHNVSGTITMQQGPAIDLLNTNNGYSGGTVIADTLLRIGGDGVLGAVPATPQTNIITSGMALLCAPSDAGTTVALHPNRHIQVRGGGLVFLGDDNSQKGRELFDVQGDISGQGVLVMNHWTGNGVYSAVRLSGDNHAFEGVVAVHGLLRLTQPQSLPSRANILLCEKNRVTGAGILEMQGEFTHAPGKGAGEVRWGEVNHVAPGYAGSNDAANSGGFSAYGGPLNVNLGGDRRTLVVGENGFEPDVLRLQSDYATDTLTWENPIDLNGTNLSLYVAANSGKKAAVWRGALSNSDPKVGALKLLGGGIFILEDGADAAPLLLTVDLDENAMLQLQATNLLTLACDLRGTGTTPVEKHGGGVVVMTGMNTYRGPTRVFNGVLRVDGTNSSGRPTSAQSGGTLAGGGAILPNLTGYVTIKAGGTLAPSAAGMTGSTLTIGLEEQTNKLLVEGGKLVFAVNDVANDAVEVVGNVEFQAGTTIDVIIEDGVDMKPRRNDTITLLSWTGTKSGEWSTTSVMPEGWKIVETQNSLLLTWHFPGTLLMVR